MPMMPMLAREVIGFFYKDASKRVRLYSLTVLEEHNHGYTRRDYDVSFSRVYGYIFHNSGSGGTNEIVVAGLYSVTAAMMGKRLLGVKSNLPSPKILETKTQYVSAKANDRNRTRQLFKLPKHFDIQPGQDLLDWLQDNGIEDESVWCSTCRDFFPGSNAYDLCEHVWWCDKTGAYSTPDERCTCEDREVFQG